MKIARNVSGMPASQEVDTTDLGLLSAVGGGDERAFASLYDRHSKLVYSVAFKVCSEPALAEAIPQNIFMQVWLAPQQFASVSASLDGKLAMLSRKLAIDLMRRRKSSGKPFLNRPSSPISRGEISLSPQKPHALVSLLPARCWR